MTRQSNLLFVNKNPGSKALTRSEGHERQKIFAHVQRLPRSTRRDAGARWVNLTTGSFDNSMLSEYESPDEEEYELHQSSASAMRKAHGRCNTVDLTSRVSIRGSFQTKIESLGAADYDPFNSTAVRADSEVADLLKFHYVSVLGNIFAPSLSSFKDKIIDFTSSKVASDKFFSHALLCLISGSIYQTTSDPLHARKFLRYRGSAIAGIKERIAEVDSTPLDPGALYGVSLMLWVDVLEGNQAGIEAHLNGLRSLVAAISMKKAPAPIVAGVAGFLNSASAITDTTPIGLSETSRRARRIAEIHSKFMKEFEIDLQSFEVGTRFFSTENIGLIGQTLSELLSERRRNVLFLPYCSQNGRAKTYEEIGFFFCTKSDIEYRLLGLPGQMSGTESLTPEQNAVRLAAYSVSQANTSMQKRGSIFARSMVSQLETYLLQSGLTTLWHPCSDLLLWVASVTASISAGQRQWDWLIPLVSKLCQVLDIDRLDKFERMMSDFFYSGMLPKMLPKIWEEAQAIRLTVPALRH